MRAAPTAALLLMALGCGREPVDTPPASSTERRGDTTVVWLGEAEHPGGGTLTADLTIGATDGDRAYLFGRVGDAAIGPDGSIYVVDSQAQAVRRYGPDGAHLHDVGRRGEGPGEYLDARYLAFHPDGRLLVGEERSGDVTVYSSDGRFLERWPVGRVVEPPLVVDAAGRLHLRLRGRLDEASRLWDDPGRIAAADAPNYVDVVTRRDLETPDPAASLTLSADGRVLDTVPPPPVAEVENYIVVPEAAGRIYIGFDYRPRGWWSWSPAGHLLSGRNDRYQVDLHLVDSLISLRRNVAPLLIVDGVQSALEAQLDAFLNDPEWRFDPMPEAKPAYHRVTPALDGRLWVRVHLPSEPNPVEGDEGDATEWIEPASAFDVIDPAGRYLGEVRGPTGIRPTWIRGDTMLAVRRDELGVDRVVRLVLAWN